METRLQSYCLLCPLLKILVQLPSYRSFQADGVTDDSQWRGKKHQTISNGLEIKKNHIVVVVVHHFNGVVLADAFTAVVWTDRRFFTHASLCCWLQLHFLTAMLCMQAERRRAGLVRATPSCRLKNIKNERGWSLEICVVIVLTVMLTTQRRHLSDMAS